jgi:hypothetical protein
MLLIISKRYFNPVFCTLTSILSFGGADLHDFWKRGNGCFSAFGEMEILTIMLSLTTLNYGTSKIYRCRKSFKGKSL